MKRTIDNGGIYYHGTYWYVPGSTFHFNPIASNVVIFGKARAFVSGWKLVPETHNSKKLSKGWGPQKSHASLMVVKDFLNDSIDCSAFCDQYAQRWKNERDSGDLLKDDSSTSDALASIFCLIDLFNPSDSWDDYELNEEGFRLEVSKITRDF